MRFYIPYNQLSAKQLDTVAKISNNPNNTYWIQGFAGTGKTLVLIHCMEKILELNPNLNVCYVTFTNALVDVVKFAISETVHERNIAAKIHVMTETAFRYYRNRYHCVFLDEIQDISIEKIQTIQNLAGALFVAGDPDQKIYRDGADERDIASIISSQRIKLDEIFRLTKNLLKVLKAVLPDPGIAQGVKTNKTAEASIDIIKCDDLQEEAAWMYNSAKSHARPLDPSAILFPSHDLLYDFSRSLAMSLGITPPDRIRYINGKRDYRPFNEYMQAKDLPIMYLGSKFGSIAESDKRPLIYLMTYHSSKGLDFKNVYLPCLNASTRIFSHDAGDAESAMNLEKRLLFVAISRCRENLFISYTSRHPHDFISNIIDNCGDVISLYSPGEHKADGGDDEDDDLGGIF
ncbi:MAG: UvrD-helicase domain-containing protein [Desulfovibrio sp.]|jgi:superfamily I DNA/RNA helicase|nr:UvrD-helicase domain-containing protein [Desulfovibrio sp.]